MKLNTRLFGEIDYQQEDVISFPNGLPSFESDRSFLILPIAGGEDALFCLQSIDTPALSFILMDPFALDPGYMPKLREEELQMLQVQEDQQLCFYVLCAMKRPVGESSVNLKCPIALNPEIRTALQVILESDDYQMRHLLSQFSLGKEG